MSTQPAKTRRSTKAAKTTGSRRNRLHDVVEAAVDVFWKKGYAAASIQDVADQVGMLKGSLYHYIESKEDLLFWIFDESHSQATGVIEEVRALDEPALERLRIFFERYVLWSLKNLERVSLYTSEWRYLTGPRQKTVREQRRAYEDFVRGLITEAQEAGDIARDLDAKQAAFFILGAVNSLATWYRRTGPDKPEQIAATYGRLILAAVSAPPRSE